MLSDLLVEIQILLTLHRRQTRILNRLDAVEPLHTSCTNVPHHHDTQRETVNGRQAFAVHLPAEEDFVGFDFGPGHANDVVHGFVVFEIGVCAVEFEMFGAVFEAAAGFDDFLQADADVFGVANGSFSPGSLGDFVALARVCEDLLDTAGTGALHCDHLLHAGESGLVHDVGHREGLGLVDQTIDVKVKLLFVDGGNASMVSNEVQIIGCDGFGCGQSLRWLASKVISSNR